MRAAVVAKYGPPDAVHVVTVDPPTADSDQVVVAIRAAAVTSGDARIRAARFPRGMGLLGRLALGLRGPRRQVLGSAFAGEIVECGSQVTEFAVGERVCGMLGAAMGGHAEQVAVRASRLAKIPPAVTDAEAAGVLFGGMTAWHFLVTKAALRPGERVLVNGASGAVGTNAVQIAVLRGARVTGVSSAANAELVRSLGAETVIDRHVTSIDEIASGAERFDVVIDTVGSISRPQGLRLLAPGGRLALVAADLPTMIRSRGRVIVGNSAEDPSVFAELLDLVADGRLQVVISRQFALEQIAQAYGIVDSGRKVGNVLVTP